jgi:hypothetical protein
MQTLFDFIHLSARIRLLCLLLFCVLGGHAFAQDSRPSSERLLSDSEVKAKYENCPGGWYSGPRPGKARFARDPWKWVVTPEFAKRFCMPDEFVSTELKGAEAVAFRLMRKGDEENCGFGGNPNACWGETVLRFEVYIKSDVKLPKRHEGRYFQVARLPSSQLVTPSRTEWQAMDARIKKNGIEPGLHPPLTLHQVGLEGVKDGFIAWSITSLGLETYYGGVFEGIDYYAFDGLTGFFENPGIKQNNVERFSITFTKVDDKRRTYKGVALSEMAHVIEFPKSFTDAVMQADLMRGRNARSQLDQAFRPSAPSAK